MTTLPSVSIGWSSFLLATAGASAVCCFTLGFIVYWKNRSATVNRTFALFNVFLGLWNVRSVVIAVAPPEWALFISRLSYVWAALVVPAIISSTLEFIGKSLHSRYSRIGLMLPALFLVLVAPTPWLIMAVYLPPHFEEVPGPLFPVFCAYLLGWTGYWIRQIFLAYRRGQASASRNHLKYMFFSLFLAFGSGLSFVLSTAFPSVPPVFHIFEIGYIVVFSYAIVRHRLMDINLVFRYGTVYSFLALVLGAPLALWVWWLTHSWGASVVSFLGPTAGHLLAVKFMPKLTRFIDRLPLFKGRYDSFKEVQKHEAAIRQSQTVDEWNKRLIHAVLDVLKPEKVNVLSFDLPTRTYRDKPETGGEARLALSAEMPFVKTLAKNNVLVRDFLDETVGGEGLAAVRRQMEDLRAEVSLPIFDAEGGMAAILNAGGNAGGADLQDLDITSLWSLVRIGEETLRGLLTREALVKKERLAAIGEMASVVSHELKTPLAVIQNSAYFLENRLTEHPDPKIQKHIGIINSQTRSLNNIISGILDYTRSRELRLETGRVNDLVRDLAAVVPIPAVIRVQLRISDDIPAMSFDREELRQALTNLINNAVQAMPEGGELEIHTGWGADGCVDIRVSDTGCGISPENMSRIFQPFFTTKSDGTGLGMAIVKRVVDRHKGKIQVQSSPGKGTTITLSLPSAGSS